MDCQADRRPARGEGAGGARGDDLRCLAVGSAAVLLGSAATAWGAFALLAVMTGLF
ncbi:hypothetical protein Shel_15890 [Slackia heliotrinireducens DSM 20476]|uniref:Uncharacterized protein n=1 Tax=Slackia heliotrinireducens (strain ATCC 29202 / DSM 20476 / NCTC 11029 / RHS 1) TaxID=471855 RepID=C7N6S3_SLAHD|nr:hypothetical protein Shel_15890 [Slackia heliotrinireducens DSM 20476]